MKISYLLELNSKVGDIKGQLLGLKWVLNLIEELEKENELKR